MMKQHQIPDWSKLHTSEEMQQLSNLGHWIEGALLAMVAILAFLEFRGIIKSKFIWPSLILTAGMFLPAFMLLHHGLSEFNLVWQLTISDSQQRQHLIMAGLLFIAGLAEIIARNKNSNILYYVWPFALSMIGLMFLMHPQHGTSEAVQLAQKIHILLGIMLVLAAIFKVVALHSKRSWISFIWMFMLLITAALLLLYKEPEGAYEKQENHHSLH